MKNILLSFFLVFAISCAEKKKFVNENHEEIYGSIKAIYPKSIQKGKEFVAKMYSTDPLLEIVNAVVECDDFSKIDSISFKIQRCTKELFIKNDTVFLAFTPTVTGEFLFENINLVSNRKGDSTIGIQKVELKYKVVN
ncbi:MAG: hypothetical protein Q8S14_00985 [Algoriphagus sp.]|uniref:hypothetical protein n=1 Tax=Algoriphagus sp. TaxID=1872435 RepID=UPI002731F5F4|nr:hypothetical protein [Algoriphagus sp.]MDP2041070.1 hypothetical protein [Algoriphagus sp.]MDP3470417.1 hypothetical protein [Algoriphagus sp.]